MKNCFTLVFFLFLTSIAYGQTLMDFGELNATSTALYNSVKAEDGIIYFINELPSNKLVKVNWEGDIVKELALPFTDSLYYNGQLLREGDRFFLVGRRVLFPSNPIDDIPELWNSQRRTVVQFNADLEIADIDVFDIIPYGAGEIVTTSGTYAGTKYPTSLSIKDNQITAVWPYVIFETQSPNPTIIGELFQYERINLTTQETFVKNLPNAQFLLDVVYLDESFYLYGDVSDTVVNGTSFNSQAVGRYNYEGQKLELFSFDANSSGGFSDGALASLNNGILYSTYFGKSVNSEGCLEDNTVIDLRDTLFNLIKRVKLPDCDLFPYGKNPFVFTSNGDFYFSAAGGGNIRLYKFDAALNVLCSENFFLPEEAPVSLYVTPEEDLIFETLFADSEMRIYKFTCSDQTSSTDLAGDQKPEITFFPNPSYGTIYTTAPMDHLSVEVYSVTGTFLFIANVVDQQIDLTSLNAGVYLLKIRNAKTGEWVSQEKIIKL